MPTIKTDPATQLDFPLLLLIGLFTAVLVIASVLAAKVISIGPFVVPAGILAYSITYPCTDIIEEIYGKRITEQVVIVGFIVMLVVLVLVKLAIIWPSAPFFIHEEAFKTVLGNSGRIIIASIIAYLVSQFTDVWLFAIIRNLTQGHFLWLRNNVATILSQLLDSVIFILIAFYGVLPVLDLIIGQWTIKVCIALLDTPFVYAGIYFIRRYKKKKRGRISKRSF